MTAINKDLLLGEVPLFSSCSQEEIVLIREKSFVAEYKKGEVIYKEGSSPSAFYCLLCGRVEIYTQDKDGQKSALEYLHRGKYFGIISLLTGEPHSVTARAFNDCSLLVIKKEEFEPLLKKIPQLAVDLSRTLSRRLKRKDIHQKTIFESTIISVFSSYYHSGKTLYGLNLCLSLKNQTHKSVVILELAPSQSLHSLPAKLDIAEGQGALDLSACASLNPQILKEHILRSGFGVDLICLSYRPEDEFYAKNLLSVLSLLVNDYHYLVLDLPSSMDRAIFGVLNQSDVIHILTSPDALDLKRTYQLAHRLEEEFGFYPGKIKIIINEYKLSRLSYEQQVEILKHSIFATLPRIEFEAKDRLVLDNPDCEYARAVKRIARATGECLVGLALGIGVGYGFCHIGVLKVLEEEKIPIDVIAGSSIGAVIAGLWAAGFSSAQILDIVSREFKAPKHIWALLDFTFPYSGFIKGKKLQKFLHKYLAGKTFYDLRLPLKIVASDVKRKEPKVLDKGPLVEAIMASCTMPGVFAPFKFKGAMLFDGGVTSPLPTEPLLRMGVKKIIAVNVTPSREDIKRQCERLKNELKVKANILDIIFSSVEILQSEVAQKEAQIADVVLHPDTSGLYWLQLHRAAEFAKRGEEEARRNIDKIKQVLNE